MEVLTPNPVEILRAKLTANIPHPSGTPRSPVSPNTEMALPTPPPEPILPADKATVYIPTPIHPVALQYAQERFGRVILWSDMSPEEGWKLADGVVNRANKVTREILEIAEKVLVISVVGVGVDSIDISTCKERRVVVTNCPGVNAHSVAELTLGLTLSLLRRISELDRKLKQGEICLSIDNLGHSLRGKIVGMVGMGSTARRAAELFHHAFSCPIHIFSPTSPPTKWTTHDPLGPLPHTRHSTLSDILPQVDILCLHCPLTPETKGLIGSDQLAMMKQGSVLINMSRGAVVDEYALCQALKTCKTLCGAASDVFEHEPVEKDKTQGLLELNNFVGTPHM
ncbi:hypothetical protein TREMEDRAFT_63559 [Tremella mesenterica DSM 1558]|uniref:uncharacterized protein n=1 Tax=Tremella mesenterica (strain ATCC 24925 / CBS 8224 / DSM 1558 / NBRC 9311 / NRRL Y-6157 / RJB 2259-6 / UBC 559-6) TaxID=578456 RepID=UPI0003F49D3C|nr:uncharacterized protein TREMEDRAFT_63559 [Tremella mesenterica DSM 1558]EIW68390.1 hypothetical protein TREMEDRAFT_63559 [Tremella mesenterica DSM 1558]